VLNQWWLMKKNIVNLFSFFPEDITFMVLHKLLQSIVRSKSNRGKLFNSTIFIRQFIFIRSFSELRKIKLIRLSVELSHNFLLLTIYHSTTSIQKGYTKNNRTSFTNLSTKYKKISRVFSLTA
jgi:hypothetical protein